MWNLWIDSQHVGSAGGVSPGWNKVDCDDMWWVSAAVCCSCSHGVDFTVFFHIKCVFSRSSLHIMFSDAIGHWMFWQCPNVSFFRQIWRKNQQSPVNYSVSIWHDLPCMLFDVPCLHKKPKVHTPTLPRRSIQHVSNFQKPECIPTPTPPQPAHDTPATYHAYTWTHQQRTMFT